MQKKGIIAAFWDKNEKQMPCLGDLISISCTLVYTAWVGVWFDTKLEL